MQSTLQQRLDNNISNNSQKGPLSKQYVLVSRISVLVSRISDHLSILCCTLTRTLTHPIIH